MDSNYPKTIVNGLIFAAYMPKGRKKIYFAREFLGEMWKKGYIEPVGKNEHGVDRFQLTKEYFERQK